MRLALTGHPGELFADARALEAAGVDSLWIDASDGDPYVALAAVSVATSRVRLVASGAPEGAGRETCAALCRGRLAIAEEVARTGERWIHADFPKTRQAWRDLRASASASGAVGVVLPNDPRLIDLLRNPDQEDERSDLKLATG